MSMNATFVQVDAADLARLQADPALAESLFMAGLTGGALMPPAFTNLAAAMQERVRKQGPQMMAGALAQLPPELRQQLEERMGRTMSALASGEGGDVLLKMMQQRTAGRGGSRVDARATLELDKAWHGVHYLLCGELEPGTALLSQPVLGGANLGDDDEGFSGYGPARYFTAAQVAELSQALNPPEVESAAAARFDAGRMSELDIYPGWDASDAEWVMDAFRNLRAFYADAASQGRAMVTCLV